MDLSQKHFERASQHHATLAKRHHAMIKIARGGMAKTDVDPQDVLDEVLEEIQAIAEEHEEMSTHCSKCAKSAGEEAMERAERADKDPLLRCAGAGRSAQNGANRPSRRIYCRHTRGPAADCGSGCGRSIQEAGRGRARGRIVASKVRSRAWQPQAT